MVFGAPLTATPMTWHAGGEDWMLTTSDVLTLYHASLSTPMVWDSDTQITIANGHITATYNGSDVVLDVQSVYYRTEDNPNATVGRAGYVIMSDSAYIKDDTQILGFFLPEAQCGALASGTMDDVMVTVMGTTESMISRATVTAAADPDHEGIYDLTDMRLEGFEESDPLSIVVTKSVTIREEIPDETLNGILDLVPLFVVVGLLIGIVGSFAWSKMR